METFERVFQPDFEEVFRKDHYLKGNWAERVFKNNNPVVLELGCGKGEYTIGLSQLHPEKNFIGVDIKGARIWKGARNANENNIQNVAFVRTRIEFIESFFGPDEVDEIWITFPDPQPSKTRIKKRLTSPSFLERYRNIANQDAIVHLKTDNTMFFEYTLEVIKEQGLELLLHTFDVDQNPGNELVLSIRTFYEEMFRAEGVPIKYLKFRLFKSQ